MDHNSRLEGWYKLKARGPEDDHVTGEIRLEVVFQKTEKKHYGPEDFQILKLIGRGRKERAFVCLVATSNIEI